MPAHRGANAAGRREQGSALAASLRLPLLVVLLSVAALWIAACGGGNSPSSTTTRDVRLVFWHTLNGPETEALIPLLTEFQTQNPAIKVTAEQVPFSQARGKFEQAVKAGLAPDLFRSDRFWTAAFAKAGALEPLDKAIAAADQEDLLPIARSAVTLDGRLWGMPHTVDCLALLYNKQHFKEQGISPPEDLDAFQDVAKKLTNAGNGRYGFFMNPDGWWFEPFLFGFGGRYYDNAGHLAVKSDQTLKAAHFLLDLKDTHKVLPPVNFRANAYDVMLQSFKSGQVSMIFNGTWSLRDILAGRAFKDQTDNLGTAVIPRGPAGRFSPIGVQSLVIPKGCRHYKETVKLISYLCSPAAEAAFIKRNFDLPARKSILFDPEIKNDPFLKPFLDQLHGAPPLENDPGRHKVYVPLEEFLRKVLNGDLPPEDALKDLDTAIRNAR